MRVVVTGANGFLGSHIVRMLVRSGYDVVSLVRKGSSTNFIKTYTSTIIEIDYNDSDNLLKIFLSADVLVHNAALAKDWGAYTEFYQTNVELAGRIHQLAHQAKIKKIIHISSIAVLGEEDEIVPKAETSKYNSNLPYFLESVIPSAMNHYRNTKREGEQAAIRMATDNNANLFILRPAWIYGPREFNAGPYEYSKTIQEGTPLMPGCSTNLFHIVYVEDVAKAVHAAIITQREGVNIYTIGSATVPLMDNFYKLFCHNLKKNKPLNIPNALLFVPTILLEFTFLFFKSKTPPLLTRGRLYMMYANNIYETDKAKRELNFEAATDMAYAIRKTVKWWKLNKFL